MDSLLTLPGVRAAGLPASRDGQRPGAADTPALCTERSCRWTTSSPPPETRLRSGEPLRARRTTCRRPRSGACPGRSRQRHCPGPAPEPTAVAHRAGRLAAAARAYPRGRWAACVAVPGAVTSASSSHGHAVVVAHASSAASSPATRRPTLEQLRPRTSPDGGCWRRQLIAERCPGPGLLVTELILGARRPAVIRCVVRARTGRGSWPCAGPVSAHARPGRAGLPGLADPGRPASTQLAQQVLPSFDDAGR